MGNLEGLFPGSFAGPEKRHEYSVAIGKFLVAFNALENAVRRTIETILQQAGKQQLMPAISEDFYKKQLVNLQLLTVGMKDFPPLPYDRLSAINGRRNVLAHGHFDQDLFSEKYRIKGRGKNAEISVSEIDALTDEAIELLHEIESAWVYLWFDDQDAEHGT